jgi:hypothetical protein
LAGVLALATAVVLAGARSLCAITEWAADAPPLVLAVHEFGTPITGHSAGPDAPRAALDAEKDESRASAFQCPCTLS